MTAMSTAMQDPSKAAIKNHHSLVLRCESGAEKYAWLARLKYVADNKPPPRSQMRSYNSSDLSATGM